VPVFTWSSAATQLIPFCLSDSRRENGVSIEGDGVRTIQTWKLAENYLMLK